MLLFWFYYSELANMIIRINIQSLETGASPLSLSLLYFSLSFHQLTLLSLFSKSLGDNTKLLKGLMCH